MPPGSRHRTPGADPVSERKPENEHPKRVPRVTGRLNAGDGQRLGISHEVTATGGAQARAKELALQIAENAPLTNQLILTALPRISDMSRSDGLWAEALTTALTQSTADAEEGLRAFLERRPPRFQGT